jgi:hypothetical protein
MTQQRTIGRVLSMILTVLALAAVAEPAAAKTCGPDGNGDLILTKQAESCTIPLGATVKYRFVHILGGATLDFADGPDHSTELKTTTFWASSILVENGGTLQVGTPEKPMGTNGGTVTIKLYAPIQPGGLAEGGGGKGVACQSPEVTFNGRSYKTCGAPPEIWFSNLNCDTNGHCTVKPKEQVTKVQDLPASTARDTYPGPKNDFFYGYHPLAHDSADHQAYFGYKVLGVGYGGKLKLYGKKGGCHAVLGDKNCADPSHTGRSWVRLKETVNPDARQLKVEVPAGLDAAGYAGLSWAKDDFIVLTTTDYLPGNSELLRVDSVQGDTIFLQDADLKTGKWPVRHIHYGAKKALNEANYKGISRIGLNADLTNKGPELRAAVGLLTRNIRIVSGGADATDLPTEESCKTRTDGPDTNPCYFGGHTVFRQGAQVQIQGAEFFQLGQGGRIAHYGVHFHHARKTQDTFVVDSSMWDSMTRWLVLHGTHDVNVSRNVGYKSIGHGFYLEDGTEINNKLLANLGVYARAAVEAVADNGTVSAQRDNPRRVPGILVAKDAPKGETSFVLPWRVDADQPTVFWIMNGWNDFQYNHAAGAGACGICYWFVPGYTSTGSRDLRWESYASLQSDFGRAGTTPLKSFLGNSCTSAMMSFNTVGDTAVCHGVGQHPVGGAYLKPIANPLAGTQPPKPEDGASEGDLNYFPGTTRGGGFRKATLGDVDYDGKPFAKSFCGVSEDDPHDCSVKPDICTFNSQTGTYNPACTPTILDRYTTSFNWAETNFAAVWLRNQWYLLQNSVITDVQQGGVNFVTGGGYTASDRLPGLWQLVYKSVFIGQSQPESHSFALDGGPFNPASKLTCDSSRAAISHCLSLNEGITFPRSNFGIGQRLFSLYDGPAVQEANAYLDTKVRKIQDCTPQVFSRGPGSCKENEDDDDCRPACPPGDQSAVCKARNSFCPSCTGLNCKFTDAPTNKKLLCERVDSGRCETNGQLSSWVAGSGTGLPKGYANPETLQGPFCYLPNAAIAWKQSNGFYYPPAFRSKNLFFQNVDIRHFVFEPLFHEGTLKTDIAEAEKLYCVWSRALFSNFTSNDRQTVLLDEDGTLTGYVSSNPSDKTTTIVNLDPFLASPVEAIQCDSDRTSRVTPFHYVTTVVYPGCELGCIDWNVSCTDPTCYGIPMYRQDFLPKFDTAPHTQPVKSLRLMGQDTAQRSSITVNGGRYYLDTAVKKETQQNGCDVGTGGTHCNFINVFRPGDTYYLFTIYAKADTKQVYEIYVGTDPNFSPTSGNDVWLVQTDITSKPPKFNKTRALTAAEASYNSGTGILTVTLDHAKLSPDFAKAAEEQCSPKTFCKYESGQCKGIRGAADDAVCRWSIIDLDCPAGGCFGFGFKLPDGTHPFVADDGDHRPKRDPKDACLKNDAAPWNLTLVEKADGECPHPADKVDDDFCQNK